MAADIKIALINNVTSSLCRQLRYYIIQCYTSSSVRLFEQSNTNIEGNTLVGRRNESLSTLETSVHSPVYFRLSWASQLASRSTRKAFVLYVTQGTGSGCPLQEFCNTNNWKIFTILFYKFPSKSY